MYLPKGFENNRSPDCALGTPAAQVSFGLKYLRDVEPGDKSEPRVQYALLYVASRTSHT